MDSVWIIEDLIPFEGMEIVAVFSTKEKAKEFMAGHSNDLDSPNWEIVQHSLDVDER